ncbi:hypothetical protein [Methanobrevibacter thaueri]|uniref:Uncharacterized protein n=1 Tax=Methanobrevibacter thaueri TaxID=190975 RepID=A0A315XQF4_9EURY|nr:hypothetical protein [Methanobrevibacter thaueri]PWB88400.1 hypothetical protein MBBTH_00060 [Methanobrevibacter thaueri]
MTSEILILTPSAVALAADSAVTIGNRKTYNGVNKLFMLSNDPPMGIMTYNLSNFSNIPLETIIKEFRAEIKKEDLTTVIEFRDKFIEFLDELVKNELYVCSFEDRVMEFIAPLDLNPIPVDEVTFVNIIRNIPNDWDYDIFGEDAELIIENLNQNNEKFINAIPNYDNFDNQDEILELFKKFFVYKEFLEPFTGIVIAGFNKNRLFPSYVEFNINYLFDDKFTFNEINDMDISGDQVHVRPLAQGDVIDTFLGNMDGNTRFKLINYVENIYGNYTINLIDAINNNPNLNDDEKQKFINEISKIEVANDSLNSSFVDFLDQLKQDHVDPILASISALPKDELSNLAESLIKITSIKRKVQSDLETVGGPIDVAIITRGDGFIWTKRKHYFDGDLNPQFFKRE